MASGWIGLLKLPSMRIGRSFISCKTAQGATPEPQQRVPPRCVGQTKPDRVPPRSPFLQYRPRFSPDEPRARSAYRFSPAGRPHAVLLRWPYLLRVTTQLTESPPLPCTTALAKRPRFSGSQVRQSLLDTGAIALQIEPSHTLTLHPMDVGVGPARFQSP